MQQSVEGQQLVEGTLLWEPSPDRIENARITSYMHWLAEEHGLTFASYGDLWHWSVSDVESFWASIVEYFQVFEIPTGTRILQRGQGVEGARFFEGCKLNYAELMFRHDPSHLALLHVEEDGSVRRYTYGELRASVGSVAEGLRKLGVVSGDRVAAVLSNTPEALIAMLATVSLGAIWSVCPPEFGTSSIVDRFSQIQPRVLFLVDSYRYGGKDFDITEKFVPLELAIESLEVVVVVPGGHRTADAIVPEGSTKRITWADIGRDEVDLEPTLVDFEHPLWILYSSGTTGVPKAIVHGHGGIALESFKVLALHYDISARDRFFAFTTPGWMLWNLGNASLLLGATVVSYNGSLNFPDLDRLWALAEEHEATYFNVSAGFLEMCFNSGLSPRTNHPKLRIRTVGSTGSPLSPSGFAWAAREVADDVAVQSLSGGTDVCSSFLAGCVLLPVHAGELQCVTLGAKVEAFDESGSPVIGEVGELVLTEPMPSMPISFWGDEGGARLHESYFSHYPGVWRHGDWVKITDRGSSIVYGRSDATLNRGGVRMGTSEFYRVVEKIPQVTEALIIDTSELGRTGELILFVVVSDAVSAPNGSLEVTPATEQLIRGVIRKELSPRHVPDRIVPIPSLPRTVTGKKLEIPVRKVLMGAPAEVTLSASGVEDLAALDEFIAAIRSVGLAPT
jgi:acetoacetyl-CoA synthetase